MRYRFIFTDWFNRDLKSLPGKAALRPDWTIGPATQVAATGCESNLPELWKLREVFFQLSLEQMFTHLYGSRNHSII